MIPAVVVAPVTLRVVPTVAAPVVLRVVVPTLPVLVIPAVVVAPVTLRVPVLTLPAPAIPVSIVPPSASVAMAYCGLSACNATNVTINNMLIALETMRPFSWLSLLLMFGNSFNFTVL